MRRLLLLGLALHFLGSISAAAERPNIIVLLADDMGWGDIGCYPKGRAWGEEAYIPTPNVDALAKHGVQCMQGYATGMVCSPSRAGLLSGQYQARWGYYGFEDSLAPVPKNIRLLPQVMHDAGYATGMIGKWHVSTAKDSLPLTRGFDRFYGFLGGQHDYYYSSLGQTFHGVGWAPDAPIFDQDQPSPGVKYLTEEFTDRAIQFMDGAHKAGKPFFLYLPYNAPHTPHQAPWDDIKPFLNGSDSGRPTPRNIVRGMIVNLDKNIGRLTQWLHDAGLEDNTIVIFSSDNGGSDGGPGRMTQHNGGLRGRKGTFYEGGIREPYIVRWPGHLPEGRVYNDPVSLVDIFATAIAVSGAAPQDLQKLDGVNLIPYLAGEMSGPPHKALYWTMQGPAASHWAIRDADLKLIFEDIHPETMADKTDRTVERKLQLYNLEDDPTESNDLIAARPEDATRLQAIYEGFLSSCKPSLYTPEYEAAHKAAMAAREKDPKLQDLRTATGSPGHWIGAGGKGRANEEGVHPPLPGTGGE